MEEYFQVGRSILKSKLFKFCNSQARHEHKTARNKFDKAFCKSKCNYSRKVINNIEIVNTTNPKEFWRHVKIFLTKQETTNPPKTVKMNNNYTTDLKSVFNEWKMDFENMYNKPSQNENFDIHFYHLYTISRLQITQV